MCSYSDEFYKRGAIMFSDDRLKRTLSKVNYFSRKMLEPINYETEYRKNGQWSHCRIR